MLLTPAESLMIPLIFGMTVEMDGVSYIALPGGGIGLVRRTKKRPERPDSFYG